MSQRRLTSLIDDLDGKPAQETVRFGLGGPSYEIDLSAAHAQQLRAALAPFIDKARKVRAGEASPSAKSRRVRIGLTIDPEWIERNPL